MDLSPAIYKGPISSLRCHTAQFSWHSSHLSWTSLKCSQYYEFPPAIIIVFLFPVLSPLLFFIFIFIFLGQVSVLPSSPHIIVYQSLYNNNQTSIYFYPPGKPVFSTTSIACDFFKVNKYSHLSLHYTQLCQINASGAPKLD